MITIPQGYKSALNLKETQEAIKEVKDYFQLHLAAALNLTRVTAPLFVDPASGLNDNLNGVERPVSFDVLETGKDVEVVHSLAKWKRFALGRYGFVPGEGLYTDMNAIRRDEETDNIHSIYVDQWDWERVVNKSDRNVDFLKDIVTRIYGVLISTETYMSWKYSYIKPFLPKEITFVTTEELLAKYPDKTAKEREYLAAKEYGAIFLMKIGDLLPNGQKHDGRAPDYDDWSLNGDIIVYYPVNDISLEISSMGIRVDEDSLVSQLEKAGCPERAELPFQKGIINKELPYTIGGGIGQSRLCMLLLRKCHIGEVQSSMWPDADLKKAHDAGVMIL